LLTPGAAVVWIASTRQIRVGSYPHSVFRKLFTVSTVGDDAVKYFGFTGGNGSGLLDGSSEFNCSGGAVGAALDAGAAGVAAPAPVCAPATVATLRADANPANIKYEIFKEPFLRRRCLAYGTSITPEP
jgi:hypothetical protein